jgi:hypothetical protein
VVRRWYCKAKARGTSSLSGALEPQQRILLPTCLLQGSHFQNVITISKIRVGGKGKTEELA